MPRLRPERLAVGVLAALAYLPALASSPGRMPADTKLYLYLDPGRLIAQAPYAWDTSQFGGWVPHQMISYLWPSGPFYWLLERLALPDWVAHRLWIGSLFLLAGWGVLTLARRLGLPVGPAMVGALVYQCSPFVVPYVSRTSLMLLPWAVLGWLVVAVLAAFRSGSWRWAAVSALLVGSIGGVNGTAFLMIVPAPVLLIAWEWRHRRLAWRAVAAATGRIAVLSAAVSAWWITMVVLQGRYGAKVLSYSETLEVVSNSSTSTEALRSMGYWLSYVTDAYAPATTAALPYMSSVPLLVVSFALPLLCLLGLIVTRWRYAGFAALLFLTGLILSVGFHPYADPAPLLAPLRDRGLALALRSSTRALPLLAMGLGLAAAACAAALFRVRPARGWAATAGLSVLAVANLVPLWTARLVDPALERDQYPPDAWLEAAAQLDEPGYRVLQLPGAEFGAYRWGYTVDPVLPGIAAQPLITRDLLPLGSPAVMDLLYALDNRAQAGSLDPRSIVAVARLLGADHLWLTNDLAFERFRTPRPERLHALLTGDLRGLGPVQEFGAAQANVPALPMIDEEALGDPLVGTPIPPVVLRSVSDPVAAITTAGRLVILDGSGDGIVDAAAAGWLTGAEPLAYAEDLSDDERARLPASTLFIVTDSNRDRTLQWRGSQDTVGMTETGGPGSDGLPDDPQEQRLPVFSDDDPSTQTIAVFDGGTVTATDYGGPLAYLPEYRAAMAVDGDPSTAWLVGRRFPPIGESITVRADETGSLRLLQPQDPLHRMMITSVEVVDADGTTRHELDETSLVPPGQSIPVRADGEVTVRIAAIAERPDAPATGTYFVGFAEMGPVVVEYLRPPTTVLDLAIAPNRLAIVFQRDFIQLTDRWRADPEPALRRIFELGDTINLDLTVTLRLNTRAPDEVLDALSGVRGPTSTRRLSGIPDARASRAFDGDLRTMWISPFGLAEGSSLSMRLAQPSGSSIAVVQPADDRYSPITELTVRDSEGTMRLDVGAPDAAGRSTIALARPLAGDVTLTVSGIEARRTTDRRYGDPFDLPAAVAEVEGLIPVTESVDAPSCRSDLLTVDGRAIPLRVDTAALLSGAAVEATPCDVAPLQLGPGEHRIVSTPGTSTGVNVDTVSMGTDNAAPGEPDRTRAAAVGIRQHAPTAFSATLGPCPDGCWVILRQGFSAGWSASIDGVSLGAARPLDGGMNAWWREPSDRGAVVDIEFAPQRVLWAALGLSGTAAALCLALALRRRRPPEACTQHAVPPPALVGPWHSYAPQRAVVAAALTTTATGLLVSPGWALPGLVVAIALVLRRRLRWAALAAWGGMGALAASVAARQLLRGYEANVTWLSYFTSLHRPMLFCAVVLAVLAAAWGDDDDAGLSAADRT